MGTPDFAKDSLEALVNAKYNVEAVVTNPDRPKGRGMKMMMSPVKEFALSTGIEKIYQPEKVKNNEEFINEIKQINPDLIVVVAYGKILPQEILDIPKYGSINVHGSLLPKYRGAAPIQWAVLNGDKVTGVTTMQMNEGLDTGDMIQKVEVPITEEETGESLHDKLAEAGAKLCVETLKAIEDHTATFEKQGESPTEYARMLDKKLGNIDWNTSAVQIERLVRGLNSWPSAYTHWGKKVVKIWRAKAEADGTAKAEPGTVLSVEKDSFTVQTGDGVLRVLELQIPGKKRMDTGAFLRGYTIESGVKFTQE
mgnify:CR=1 FL=1